MDLQLQTLINQGSIAQAKDDYLMIELPLQLLINGLNLNRGWYKQPTGGHMITVVGEYDHGFICHDPYGYPISGEYGDLALDGSNVPFSHESLRYRWLVEGHSSGWGRIFH